MEIEKYEIDVLDVKSADACLIHFFTKMGYEYVVLIDAGFYDDGKKVADFIRKHYKQQYIDLAICTHCDDDHYGGFLYLIEQIRDRKPGYIDIKEFWINDPADHMELGKIKWYRNQGNMEVEARSVYDYKGTNLLVELEKILDTCKWYEPFSNASEFDGKPYVEGKWSGIINVVGPSLEYYEELVPDFRNDLQKKNYDTSEEDEHELDIEKAKNTNKKLKDAGDDPSTHNKSSVMIMFTPKEGEKYFFMGDASRESVEKIHFDSDFDSTKDVKWLKVPHHGSMYNLDSDLIQHLSPKVSVISTEKYGHYLSRAVVNELKKVGSKVFSTHVHKCIWHQEGTDNRTDYHSIDGVECDFLSGVPANCLRLSA